MSASPVDRPRDRDRLALAARQPRHGDVDARDVDPDLIQRAARLALHLAVGQERQRAVHALAAQEQVVVDRQFVDQRQVLIDGVDPFRARVVDAFRRVRLPVQEHLPAVLALEAAEDLDQRRLARAVVAEQAQHLALLAGAG